MAETLSVVGLGKLGASMVAAIASRGINVIGLDINPAAVQALAVGRAPVQETDLAETIANNIDRIRATSDMDELILNSSMTFVIVPTPSDERGAFSLEYAAAAMKTIGASLAKKDEYHTVVLTSTVLSGSCRYGLIPVLEKEAGKIVGRDFGFCYSPEFIALGSVIKNFLNPDFTLVGEYDERSGKNIEEAYSKIMPKNTPCKRMSLENAELAKISLNAYVTSKITFANMLAEICQQIPGGDVDVVTEAIGLDSRIGRKYLTGALGFGGPCFPRDNVALAFFADAVGIKAKLPEATDFVNRSLAGSIAQTVKSMTKPDDTVAVLGLAYKPQSHVLEESQGIALSRALCEIGVQVKAHDPLSQAMDSKQIPAVIQVCKSVDEVLKGASAVLITTPDEAYASLKESDFAYVQQGCVILDFWRILKNVLSGFSQVRYVPYGCGTKDERLVTRLKDLWSL